MTSLAVIASLYPAKKKDLKEDGWNISPTGESLAATFPELDQRLIALFLKAEGIKTRRLYNNHEPYPCWVKGKCCLLGDAARLMMPAYMAMEDAGALGILFSPKYASLDVAEKLRLYEFERRPRATGVLDSSRRARVDRNERRGWSSAFANDRPGKLTIEDVSGHDMHARVAQLVKQQWRRCWRLNLVLLPTFMHAMIR